MQIEVLRLVPNIALRVPGAPYYAVSATVRGALIAHRNHDYAEFTAITAGEGQLVTFVDDHQTRVEALLPGQLYLFRPIDVHQIVGVGRRGVTLCNIAFTLTAWQTYLRLAELDPGLMTAARPPMVQFDIDDPAGMRPHYRALDRFWKGATMLDLLEFWTEMASRFAPRGDSQIAAGAPDWLLRAIEEMRDENNLRRGMKRFLELCHVSPAHLWRTAVRYCGMTPTELLSQLRMGQAAMLLVTTTETVATIADRMGFANATYFSRVFRRANLVSPMEYRRRAEARLDSHRHPAERGPVVHEHPVTPEEHLEYRTGTLPGEGPRSPATASTDASVSS